MTAVYNNTIGTKQEFDQKFTQFLEKFRGDQRGRFSVSFPKEPFRKINIEVWIKSHFPFSIATPSFTIDENYIFLGERKNINPPALIKHFSTDNIRYHPAFKKGGLKPFYIDYKLAYDKDSAPFIKEVFSSIQNRYKQIEKVYKQQALQQLRTCVIAITSVALIGIACIGTYFYRVYNS